MTQLDENSPTMIRDLCIANLELGLRWLHDRSKGPRFIEYRCYACQSGCTFFITDDSMHVSHPELCPECKG